MITSIVKKYTFEAAHRLGLGYVGKCANLHGHSYCVSVEIAANNINKLGMVIDFGDLKGLKYQIMEAFDHKTILQKDDEFVPLLRAIQGFETVITTLTNPTCEALASIIFSMTEAELSRLYPEGPLSGTYLVGGKAVREIAPQVVSVTIQETETGSATFRGCQK